MLILISVLSFCGYKFKNFSVLGFEFFRVWSTRRYSTAFGFYLASYLNSIIILM
jgi:hypothetical protein